ncbi:DUF7147 family protein [Halalkalibacillus halophilus]|uniref:DUF7147 family protein n=1 Tax=Halalkalibacillus halophilus TaxID=392827 RepID=UPI000410F585|nr:hypothetical protein [Halalkalibacillus halophilus]
MSQHFIKLGHGYGDVYELFTLIEAMPTRVNYLLAFHTYKAEPELTSIAALFKSTTLGNFQPIYICLEGIPKPQTGIKNSRFDQFQSLSKSYNLPLIQMDVPKVDAFHEEELYFRQLTSVLRLNHLLPPL